MILRRSLLSFLAAVPLTAGLSLEEVRSGQVAQRLRRPRPVLTLVSTEIERGQHVMLAYAEFPAGQKVDKPPTFELLLNDAVVASTVVSFSMYRATADGAVDLYLNNTTLSALSRSQGVHTARLVSHDGTEIEVERRYPQSA